MKLGILKSLTWKFYTLCKGIVGIKMYLEDNCQIFNRR